MNREWLRRLEVFEEVRCSRDVVLCWFPYNLSGRQLTRSICRLRNRSSESMVLLTDGREYVAKALSPGELGNLYRAGWEDWICSANCFDHNVAGPLGDRRNQVWK